MLYSVWPGAAGSSGRAGARATARLMASENARALARPLQWKRNKGRLDLLYGALVI